MDISIIVRAKNEEKNIRKCILSILQQKTDANYEIILLYDSTSTDNTLKVIEDLPIRIIKVQDYLPKFTMSSSVNLGIKHSKGKIIIILSGDALPIGSNWLDNIIKPLEKKRIIAVSCTHIPRKDCNPMEKRRIIETYKKNKDFFSNVCTAYKKMFLIDLPFDENILSAEEKDWKNKILKAGYKTVSTAKCNVLHSHEFNLSRRFNLGLRKGASYSQQMILLPNPKTNFFKYIIMLFPRMIRKLVEYLIKDYKFIKKEKSGLKWYFLAWPYETIYLIGFYFGPLIKVRK